MYFVITAAGNGSRFKNVGIHLPKPLIEIRHREALLWSIDSLPLRMNDELILITRKDQNVRARIGEKIRKSFPQVETRWIEIDQVTNGQLDTALLAKDLMNKRSDPVAIYNCDTYFECPELSLKLEEKYDGVVPCAPDLQGESWSFVDFDPTTRIASEIAEKKKISKYASAGYYGFRSVDLFFKYAQEYLVNKDKSENYIAPMYNDLIKNGLKVYAPLITGFFPFGTPEQIRDFWPKDVQVKYNDEKVIVIDLDDTLTIDGIESYDQKRPNAQVIEKLKLYKINGYKVVVHTARNMKTQANDVGRVVANVGEATLSWLRKHDVPFDSLVFGKPYAENGFYVDDKAIRPKEFIELTELEIMNRIGRAFEN